ncbi:hypothetical protein C7999DRAFT_43570 [Corynascus novoguineensis]|uniref:NACHT domain-containing protein n=1 Tax=Corynascus novoguineensis TaxID=1126955 RepID=A0AAN7CN64_9PEZI|nr:hypothetical protein C7999DRAFT_43570 [Corynascus novoguineensis]
MVSYGVMGCMLDTEAIDRIRKWLEPTPYYHEGGEYRRHLTSHVDGTGQWLIATETYQKWHDGEDRGLLWIRGIPGSGKSVFAAMLTNELVKEGHPVLFFFFRQIIKANHEPVQMLRDWLDQILEYSPPLQRELKVYIDKTQTHLNRELSSLSIDDLWKHLKSALAHLRRVYLVADALDEMSKGNEEFLKALAKLGSWKPSQVKVLITSRPVNTVEAPLCQLPALRIRLEESLVDSDIAKFVDHSLGQSTIPPEERALIKYAVPGRANGLFLYAKLAMDAFLEPNADVGQILTKLPTDLNAMYDDLLKEHAKTSGVSNDIQHLLLCWATHAIRPLRLLEMAEMLSATYDMPGDRHDLKSAKALVRVACGPLLEIHPDETVSIVHHSLTEFLVGTTRSRSAGEEQRVFSFPVLLPGPTHEQLALSCIRYLELSGCLDSVLDAERTEEDAPAAVTSRYSAIRLQFPFADYACKNWAVHAAKSMSDAVPSGALLAAIDGFLAPGRRLDAWLSIEWLPRATKGVTSSHVAARFGLTHYLETLVQCARLPDVNSRDSEEGHAGVVKLLIDIGADPDAENYVGLKPLHRAATNGHAAVVAVLLHAGVDPLTKKTRDGPYPGYGKMPSTIGQTPLMYACQAGHVAAVEAFLPYLKGIETMQWALHWASKAGQAKVVQRLLQHPGVDVNAKLRGYTPLFHACAENDVATIETLLEAGADATILCSEKQSSTTAITIFQIQTRELQERAHGAVL